MLLADLLTYQNPSVIKQFCYEHPGKSVVQAEQIFQDLLAWFWLSEYRSKKTHMIAPLAILDAMWHVFILHTRAYHAFCQQYFGHYLHHDVEVIGEEYVIAADELAEFLSDCYDHLGEAWLARNFSLPTVAL